jgi:oxepin-CoA hydrolase/3-oxo-5,6-dehydrosuberyl-CoA semialdehyde dehydrogenase
MTAVPFDVNDDDLRESFLRRVMFDALTDLTEDTLSLWGTMTPQQMIEHLRWAFQCSTGIIELPCYTPGNLLERAKRFLYDNRQTPHQFKNPAIGENMPPLHFSTLADAKAGLQKEIIRFFDHFREVPDAIHVHPIFGPLEAQEWQRSHFKHCYHHLCQFGIIDERGTTSV